MVVTLSDRWKKFKKYLPSNVNLLAVSKGHSSSAIRSLAKVGQKDFGESRLQEALSKLKDLEDLKGIRWHFIGRIQSNKVRGLVKSFDVIHSVDSLALAERISRISGEENKCPQIMLQVKFAKDPNKLGFSPQHLLDVWPRLIKLPNLQLIGLMTMTPVALELDGRRALFENCRNLANHLKLEDCSMGMSRDWEEAVDAGSTWLRLGSALFGHRLDNVSGCRDITKNT